MRPEYRNNRDDAPRPVAAMAKTFPDGDRIPLHLHKRGQLIHAIHGTMKVETADAAWIVPPALARHASLEKDVVIAGVYDHLEIWERTAWAVHLRAVEGSADDVAERLAEKR